MWLSYIDSIGMRLISGTSKEVNSQRYLNNKDRRYSSLPKSLGNNQRILDSQWCTYASKAEKFIMQFPQDSINVSRALDNNMDVNANPLGNKIS